MQGEEDQVAFLIRVIRVNLIENEILKEILKHAKRNSCAVS